MGIGGKERQLGYLIGCLKESHTIQLILLNNRIEYKEILSDVHIYTVLEGKKHSISYYKKFRTAILNFQPDIIHSWDHLSPLLSYPFKWTNKNIRIIDGSIRAAGPAIDSLKIKFLIYLSHLISDFTVSNSKVALNQFRFLRENKSNYIHNGFDIQKFKRIECGDRLFNSNNIRVIMLGRFQPLKDYRTLINAIETNRESLSKVEFILVGDGESKKEIESLVKQKQLSNVKLLGSRDDVPCILRECHVGLMVNPPDRGEGISNSVMEYMASGLPVIATNNGGTPELVQDGINGFLIPPGSPEFLGSRIVELINNPELRKSMGLKSQEQIEKNFSIESMVSQYVKLYQKLTSK